MIRIIYLLILQLTLINCYAQNIVPIIQSGRYNNEISSTREHYYFFGRYYIDKENRGIINLTSLEQGINKVVKDVDYNGYILLDIENKIYQELKSETIYHKNYHKNINAFVEMVEMVKALRPNAKVGVYGFPFNFNYQAQKKNNDFEKLKPLLKTVDFFAPQIYVYYTENEKSDDFLDKYINDNLSLYFDYASKINKKVYPFIWYKIHPYNKKYGGEVMSNKQYWNYLNNIKNFRYKGKKVEKIIYWEPSEETITLDKKLKETINLLK